MGTSLNWGPFEDPFYEGAVLCWRPKKVDPNLENYPPIEGLCFWHSKSRLWGPRLGFGFRDGLGFRV